MIRNDSCSWWEPKIVSKCGYKNTAPSCKGIVDEWFWTLCEALESWGSGSQTPVMLLQSFQSHKLKTFHSHQLLETRSVTLPVCLLCTSPSFGLCCLNSHEAPFVWKMFGLISLKCSQIAKPRRVWKIEHSCAHAVSKSSKTVHLHNFKLSFLVLSY